MIPGSTEHNDCNVFTDRSENMIACCNIWNAFPYDVVILFKIILAFPNYLGCPAYTNIKRAFHLIFWYLSFVPSFCGTFRFLMVMNAVFSVIAGVPTLFAVLDRDSRIFPRCYFRLEFGSPNYGATIVYLSSIIRVIRQRMVYKPKDRSYPTYRVLRYLGIPLTPAGYSKSIS
jgi:hypothetical protein